MRCLLLLLIFPWAAVAQSPSGEPPRVEPPAWQGWLEGAGGPDPFVWHVFGGGARVRLPKGWRAVEHGKGAELRFLAGPPGVAIENPTHCYLLMVRPLPEGMAAGGAKRHQARVLATRKLVDALGRSLAKGEGAGAGMTIEGEPTDRQLDGVDCRELTLAGKAGEVAIAGRLRGRATERSVLVSLAFWPKTEGPAHRRLFDHVDGSLQVRAGFPGVRLWLPVAWAGQASRFGGRGAVTYAHRRLHIEPDPAATRLIVTHAPGDDPRAAVDGVAARLRQGEPGLALVKRDACLVGHQKGARTLLGGKMGGRTRSVWIVCGPALEAGGDLILAIALGDSDALTGDAPRIEGILRSLAPQPKPKPAPPKPAPPK